MEKVFALTDESTLSHSHSLYFVFNCELLNYHQHVNIGSKISELFNLLMRTLAKWAIKLIWSKRYQQELQFLKADKGRGPHKYNEFKITKKKTNLAKITNEASDSSKNNTSSRQTREGGPTNITKISTLANYSGQIVAVSDSIAVSSGIRVLLLGKIVLVPNIRNVSEPYVRYHSQ